MAISVNTAAVPASDLWDETTEGVSYVAQGTLVGVRPWTRRDRSVLATWPQANLPAHWMVSAHPMGDGPRTSFAIDAFPATSLVGRISLRDITGESARLGIYLRPDQYNQGLGTAALLAFQRFVFGRRLVRALVLDVAQDNTRAVRAYLRAGWRVVGTPVAHGRDYFDMMVEVV